MNVIEHAARNLCLAAGQDPDRSVMRTGFQRAVESELRRPGEGPYAWQRYIPQVMTVLSAIEEADTDLVAKVKADGLWNCTQDEVGAIFTAMIDAMKERAGEMQSTD